MSISAFRAARRALRDQGVHGSGARSPRGRGDIACEGGSRAAQWRERRTAEEGRNGEQGVTKARAVLYRKAVDVNSLFRLSSQ